MGCSCRVKMTSKFVAQKLHPFYTKSGLFVDWKWFHPIPFEENSELYIEILFQENVIVWLFVEEKNIDYRKRNFRKFYFLSSNLQENY